MKITAEALLRLLIRTATHFLGFAWEMLGEKKKIIDIQDKSRP